MRGTDWLSFASRDIVIALGVALAVFLVGFALPVLARTVWLYSVALPQAITHRHAGTHNAGNQRPAPPRSPERRQAHRRRLAGREQWNRRRGRGAGKRLGRS